MRHMFFGLLALGVAAFLPGAAAARSCQDDAAVALARSTIAAQCDCDKAANHGDYVSCVAQATKALVAAGKLPVECKGAVTQCAARSTCGKPGFVTCCRVDSRGRTKCSIKSSASKCTSSSKTVACVGAAASCCDSCVASSPGGAFVCEGTTTTAPTTTLPTTTVPTTTVTTTTTPTTTTLPGSPSGAFFDATS